MILQVTIEGRQYRVELDRASVEQAAEFFDRMDRDMDRGWQMGREFIPNPDRVQRAQIAANRLLLALEQENENLTQAMAGYIVTRLPGVTGVEIDTTGEMQSTQFFTGQGPAPSP
jgi:hypothetical protein